MSESHIVYLGLGSNLGRRQDNLAEAVRRVAEYVTLEAQSSIYETKPWGFAEQPDFLNQVVAGRTSLGPQALLRALKAIETSMGREAVFRNGPRLIDIDILVFDDLRTKTDGLTLPHARLAERAFVTIPLAEINPDLVIPGTQKTAADLAARFAGSEDVIRRIVNPEGE